MNAGSFLLSLALHAAVLLLLIFWPEPAPLKLDRNFVQVSLVEGAPGGNRLPSSILGPQGQLSDKRTPPKANPSKAIPLPNPSTASPQKAVAPEKNTNEQKVNPKAEPKAVPKPPQPKAPAPTPAPTDDAIALSKKKALPPQKEKELDPDSEKKPEAKKKNQADDQDVKKPDAKAKPSDAPASKDKGDSDDVDPVQAALAHAKRNAQDKPQSGRSAVARALSEAKRGAAKGAGGGGGGEGDGPGGGGLGDVYAALVKETIRPNWEAPVFNRNNYVVQIKLVMDTEGNLVDCSVEQSSGRPDFDATAISAVRRTKVLPAPPTPEHTTLLLYFNSQELF